MWVTTLDKAEPVKGTAVSVRDCNGKELWKGKTDGKRHCIHKNQTAIRERTPTLPLRGTNYTEASHALNGISSGLFVFAKTSNDMTFVHSSWDGCKY